METLTWTLYFLLLQVKLHNGLFAQIMLKIINNDTAFTTHYTYISQMFSAFGLGFKHVKQLTARLIKFLKSLIRVINDYPIAQLLNLLVSQNRYTDKATKAKDTTITVTHINVFGKYLLYEIQTGAHLEIIKG